MDAIFIPEFVTFAELSVASSTCHASNFLEYKKKYGFLLAILNSLLYDIC